MSWEKHKPMIKKDKFDLVISSGQCFLSNPQNPEKITEKICDIGVKDGVIKAIENSLTCDPEKKIDASGLQVLPGLIDSQVHFRDPGHPLKENFDSGTKGAILGGITAIFDMPNTSPSTSYPHRFLEKLNSVRKKAHCDFGLFAGATENNQKELMAMEDLEGCCGIKIFMGSSTGDLLVSEDKSLEKILTSGKKMISVHCEDEKTLKERREIAVREAHPKAHPLWRNVGSALRATKRIVKLAKKTGRKIHTLHITTKEEIEFLKQNKDTASFEILPQHLFFSAPDCYEKLGTYAQMNPPIRDLQHQEALKKALQDGAVDVVASDHAPHTKDEKSKTYPNSPSGLTGVQTIVPIMVNFVNQGLLSLSHLARLMSINPARIFKAKRKGGIFVGQDADFSIIDINKKQKIDNQWIVSQCGWTPYHGVEVTGWPVVTIIRGNIVMQDGKILREHTGQPIEFQ